MWFPLFMCACSPTPFAPVTVDALDDQDIAFLQLLYKRLIRRPVKFLARLLVREDPLFRDVKTS